MFFKKKSYVGVDLGHKMIKLAQVEKVGAGWKVVRTARAFTPAECMKDGIVVDPQMAGAAIRTAMREGRIGANAAVIAVAGATVIVRTVRIAKMAEATLRKSIKYEAGRYVPSSVEDSFIECEILGDAAENMMDVLVVAAPRELVDSRVAACKSAGLQVDVVDVEAFAMYRSLVESALDTAIGDGTVALVDIGDHTTNVSVISNRVFSMARSIPQAGRTLTEALKTYFKLNDEDAELGKSQLDLRDLVHADRVKENPPLRVLQPHVDELVREIRRSLNYYQSQRTEQGAPDPVSRLLVSGGGAQLPGLGEYLSHKLGLEVLAIGVLDNPHIVGPGDDDAHGYDLSVASGLAMRALMKAA